MRRKRRSGGTWLPTIGSVIGEGDPGAVLSGRGFQLDLINGEIETAITPITFDQPRDLDDNTPDESTMADVIGSEYILKRIVGKIFAVRHITFTSGQDTDLGPGLLFGAGFFVARANDVGSGGGPNTPIGSASSVEERDNYSPLDVDTVREPWIWRRTWILGNAGATGVSSDGPTVPVALGDGCKFPPTTADYGSVMDGPHIDAKSVRRITSDERLWFAISVAAFPIGFNQDPANEIGVRGYLDYRLFGQLRKARNRGVF